MGVTKEAVRLKYRELRGRVQVEPALGLTETSKRTKSATFRKRYDSFVASASSAGTVWEYGSSLGTFQRLMAPGYVDSITTATIDQFITKRR